MQRLIKGLPQCSRAATKPGVQPAPITGKKRICGVYEVIVSI